MYNQIYLYKVSIIKLKNSLTTMKIKHAISFFLLLVFIVLPSCSDKKTDGAESISVLPVPLDSQLKNGSFSWNDKTSIVIIGDNKELEKCATFLKQILSKSTGNNITITKGDKENADNAIVLAVDKDIDGSEAYNLQVSKNNILVKGSQPVGVFYGIQTLLQLMPPEVMKLDGLTNGFTVAAIEINDAPRFSYRGMHLDVSRNFMTKEEVMNYIDLIAMFKFNYFHWHLTDGAGWRIEIKKYPLLTQKTAFRAESNWKEFWNNGRKFVDEGTPNAYGGYYTQEDIKEVVQYAANRFITIIPEIEMPAHSEEVFVAYPELSCSGIPYKDSDFCAGNDSVFSFVEDVLTEVMDLFPSQYIHIGGDEAGKAAWKTCPKCQKRIKDENLTDVNELQSYFIKRVSKFIKSKGRTLVGWDEIIDGGLASDAVVMLWRDPQTGVEAARHGNSVIMTPGAYCYFDTYQADPTTEPESIGGYITLRKVYSFEVIPNDSLAEYFIGGQANIWAEYIPDYKRVQYMAFPRVIALSETLWSAKSQRNWEDFKRRLPNALKRLDYMDVNYHKPSSEIEIFEKVDSINKRVGIYLETERYQPTIRYTLDGSIPNENSAVYTDTVFVDKPVQFTVAIFEEGQPIKPTTRRTGYNLSTNKPVSYLKKWTSYPAGGEIALTDGLTGGLTYSDGLWQGFTSDMEVIIDLQKPSDLSSFSAKFMQLIGPGVYMPEYVKVSISSDGKNYEDVLDIKNEIPRDHDRLCFKEFEGSLSGKTARYVKVFAKNKEGFIFTDEIIIN